jgi:hypothetical protein
VLDEVYTSNELKSMVKSPPKAPVILNEDLNEANSPLIGALINCKCPANPCIAPVLGFTLTDALFGCNNM